MEDAKFTTPFVFPKDLDKLPVTFDASMQFWLNAKNGLVGEKRVFGTEKLVVVKLSNYKAAEVAFQGDNGRYYFLVGDAAVGVPFFRALNVGLVCGTKLAYCVHDLLHKQFNDPQQSTGLSWFDKTQNALIFGVHKGHQILRAWGDEIRDYQALVDELALGEFALSETKSLGLDLGSLFVKVAAAPPWQLLTLSDDEATRFSGDSFKDSSESAEIEEFYARRTGPSSSNNRINSAKHRKDL